MSVSVKQLDYELENSIEDILFEDIKLVISR